MNRGLCATFGFKLGPGQGKAFVDRVMEAARTPGLGQSITALLAVRTGLTGQIKEMNRVLRDLSNQSQSCQPIMRILDVCVQKSAAFVAAVDEVGRFRQSRTAGAYFGLVPRRHQSGQMDWTGRITKQGNSMVRERLYTAANRSSHAAEEASRSRPEKRRLLSGVDYEKQECRWRVVLTSSCTPCCPIELCSKHKMK